MNTSNRSLPLPSSQKKASGAFKGSFRKNDKVTLRIEDMSQEGAGIGKADGYTVFVKDTVIGDLAEIVIVKAMKNYGFGRLLRILEPSKDRVEPACPLARPCGGCQLQMLAYPRQLQFKEEKVRNDLIRIGGFAHPPVQEILGMEYPYRYRNKAQFPIGYDRNGRLTAGFYAGRTHTIIPCQDCLLGVEENQQILAEILNWMEEHHIPAYREETGKGFLRHVLIRKGFATGELMVCLVINSRRFPAAEGRQLAQRLSRIPGMRSLTYSSNTRQTNVILGDKAETLWGQNSITDRIGNITYEISPLSFYQVNPRQTRVLYEKALEYAGLTGTETVWDLYCGIGTISLFLAQRAKEVYGIEILPQAVEDARRNAEQNGIENAYFYAGKAEELLPEKCRQENLHAHVIVVDPPRKGCQKSLLDTMIQMQPDRIVYVSCDPATLARDLKYLCAGGYRLEKVQPVDQFPQGVHVECVVLMSRKDT